MFFACPDCITERMIPKPEPSYAPLLCRRHREQGTQDGTRWCLWGQGSSVAALLSELGEGSASDGEKEIQTGLLLTGQPLGKEDHRRILHAVAQARGQLKGGPR